MKWIIVALVLLLAVLQYKLWLSNDGVHHALQAQKQLDEKLQENTRLTERNEALAAELEDLRKGSQAIEEHARNNLGMIKEDETYYQIVDIDRHK